MQDLLAGLDLFRLEVRRTVGLEVVEKVLVVDHETARVAHPPGGQVGPPVDPPQHRAVPQVEVGDRVGGVAPVLLEVLGWGFSDVVRIHGNSVNTSTHLIYRVIHTISLSVGLT